MTDVDAMARAVSLSANGFPSHAHVGCVVLDREGNVVGEGFHDHAGGAHAEAVALAQAGERARGGTAYVTLEPCNHQGRTPPCSLALISSGVSRVVVAVADPNPKASGGAATLKAAGIGVEFGLLAAEAAEVNWQFLGAMRLRRPMVTLKAAMSLDGRVALPSGESKWITGRLAREAAHRLRAECTSVLVGEGTVAADDPLLTARIPGVVNQPIRIVLDPDRKLSPSARVFNVDAPALHIVAEPIPGIAYPGSVEQVALPLEEGSFNLPRLLTMLFERGVVGLLVEGGPRTISSFLTDGLWDRLKLFIAPKILGQGPAWAALEAPASLGDVASHKLLSVEQLGEDLLLTIAVASRS